MWRKWSFFEFCTLFEQISSRKLALAKKRLLRTYHLHKETRMSAVPLDVAPERRTKQCSPRFRPGDRFWNQVSDTCRQALRERNVGP